MKQEYIIGDVVMYDNKIMVIKEPRDGTHFDLSCPEEKLVYCCVGVEDIKPMPLTSEILEKNGFEVRVSRVYYTKLIGDANFLQIYIAIERKRNDWAVFIRYKKMPDSVLLRHIQYVHELQNILWGVLGLDSNMKV